MIDGIFRRLTPPTADALRRHGQDQILPDFSVEELTSALKSVKGDLDIAHASLQKLYEEARYVYTRLDHMEQSLLVTQKEKSASSTVKQESDEEGGEAGGQSGGGVIVEKVLFVGESDGRLGEKLGKISEAKELTRSLLSNIETLALKVQNTATEAPRLGM